MGEPRLKIDPEGENFKRQLFAIQIEDLAGLGCTIQKMREELGREPTLSDVTRVHMKFRHLMTALCFGRAPSAL